MGGATTQAYVEAEAETRRLKDQKRKGNAEQSTQACDRVSNALCASTEHDNADASSERSTGPTNTRTYLKKHRDHGLVEVRTDGERVLVEARRVGVHRIIGSGLLVRSISHGGLRLYLSSTAVVLRLGTRGLCNLGLGLGRGGILRRRGVLDILYLTLVGHR